MNISNTAKSYGDFIRIAAGEKHDRALSIVSHDLKSPLNGLLGLSKIIEDQMQAEGADPLTIEMIGRVISAGEKMRSLIEDINLMVKMEAGKEPMEPSWVRNLGWEMQETVRTFELQAKSKNIALSLITCGNLPPVRWDVGRLRNHAFNNIISNALKFTPDGGEVTLSATAVSGYIELKIADTGSGIPPGEEESIFSRFGQLDMESERTFSGVGLGLYNARLFIEKHGGQISVDSSYKKGASFLIKLPLDAIAGGGDSAW